MNFYHRLNENSQLGDINKNDGLIRLFRTRGNQCDHTIYDDMCVYLLQINLNFISVRLPILICAPINKFKL